MIQMMLPKGTKQKVKKAKPNGPKKGHRISIAPKKAVAIEQVILCFH